jgi:transcriptional regulator with XRE-family HTH domain
VDHPKIGIFIKKARTEKNLTQKELAKKINVSPQVVSNWERDYTPPNAQDIFALSEVLGNFLAGTSLSPPQIVLKLKEKHNLPQQQMGRGTRIAEDKFPYGEQEEIFLDPDDLKVLEQLKKQPILFHKLKNASKRDIKQFLKIWELIDKDMQTDADDEDVIDDY